MGSPEAITITTPGPEGAGIVHELRPLVETARAHQISDVASHEVALHAIKRLRDGERRLGDLFEPARKAADNAKKQILALRDGLIGPLAQARAIYDAGAQQYEAAQRKAAEDEQRRLEEQARKEQEDRTILDAIAAEESGDKAGAEAILAQPVAAPMITVAPQVAKVAGITERRLYSAKVENIRACLAAMLADPAWHQALERLVPEVESIMRPLAIAQRHALKVPGVRVVETVSRAAARS